MPARHRVNLVELARVCREADSLGLPRVATVAEVFGFSERTARRKIDDAVQFSLLAASSPSDLDHRPVVAEINRGGKDYRRVTLCNACLSPFPCSLVEATSSVLGTSGQAAAAASP